MSRGPAAQKAMAHEGRAAEAAPVTAGPRRNRRGPRAGSALHDCRRTLRQQTIPRLGWGTAIRHDLFPGAVAAVALSMGKAAVAIALVAAAGLAQRLLADGVSAAADAIDLTTVAIAADQDLLPAAPAEKQTRRAVFIMFGAARA